MPEHNSISERKHYHIVETGLSLLTHAGMPKSYWTYAFATATYLINRLPTPMLAMTSPFQKLFGTPPSYSKLHIFGFLCFPWLRPYNNNKLENRSTPCVFLGYSPKAHICVFNQVLGGSTSLDTSNLMRQCIHFTISAVQTLLPLPPHHLFQLHQSKFSASLSHSYRRLHPKFWHPEALIFTVKCRRL